MLKAQWLNEEFGVVSLPFDWNSHVSLPEFTLQPSNIPITDIERFPAIEFARRSGYCRQGNTLHFILDPSIIEIPFPLDKVHLYVSGSFNGWASAIGDKAWELTPSIHFGIEAFSLSIPWELCYSPGKKQLFKFVTSTNYWLNVPKEAPNSVIDKQGNKNYQLATRGTGNHLFYFKTPIKQDYPKPQFLEWRKYKTPINYLSWLHSMESKLPLGAIVSDNSTTFRLFAPRAAAVELCYYDKLHSPHIFSVLLNKNLDGTWETTMPENLHGWYYYYQIAGGNFDNFSYFSTQHHILDPYAKAVSGPQGPGIVIDWAKHPTEHIPFIPPSWDDLVIMEAHVRDLITHARIALDLNERLGFTGLAKWIKTEDNYLKSLGINAIELQPIQEFDNQTQEEYHWGYMPINYFSPATAYALNPEKASQINEFKELVQAFHEAGIAVILDVVYNHVGEPNHLLFIDKAYYFETTDNGDLYNYSGCGNDLRANTPMGRRLIIDSLIHLVKTYDVDGFRFDLAELIGVEVLQEVQHELKKIKPSLILIAEPWSFRGHIGYDLKKTDFTSWNDGYREFTFNYVRGQGNHDGFRYFIKGSLDHLARFPAQTVNYTESHDDRTWIDKITENAHNNGNHPSLHDEARTHLMFAFLFASLGIPMIAEGQDFLRSKNGISNTYKNGELNALNYNRLIQFSSTHDYCRAWIRFRLSEDGKAFRPAYIEDLESFFSFFHAKDASSSVVLYNKNHTHGPKRLLFAINPHDHEVTITLHDLNPIHFKQIADQKRFDCQGLHSAKISWVGNQLSLPPLSCGLWIS